MLFIDDMKKGLHVLLHPRSLTDMSISEAMKFYYKFSIIPFLLYLIVALAVVTKVPHASLPYLFLQFTKAYGFGLPGIYGQVITSILYILVAVPLSILINAALFHAIGKYVLKEFGEPIAKTVTAAMYTTLVNPLLLWLALLPYVGLAVYGIIIVWEIVILIFSLSTMQVVKLLVIVEIIVIALAIIVALSYIFPYIVPYVSLA